MLTEKEAADDELRATATDVLMRIARVILSAVDSGPPQVVLAIQDAGGILREFEDGMKTACREVRNANAPVRPRTPSEHPARSGTMPSPSEGAARDDWHLADHVTLAEGKADALADATRDVAEPIPKRLSTIRPPPPSTGIPPVPSIATAATDPAPPPKPKPKPEAKKAAARTKAKQKRKR